ncbi:hypothetical protein D9M68_688300 [compost metagenome]
MVEHLLEAHRVVAGHGVRRVGHDGQVVRAVVAPLQPVEVGRVPAQADGRDALADAAHDLGAHALFHVDADVAVRRVLQEAGHVLGQRLGHDRGRGQDAHVPARAARVGGHVALDAGGAAEHGARVFEQRFAGRRGHHAAALAQQQRRADRVFELREALADRRADDVGLLAGARDAAAVADGDEQAQGGQVEVSHEVPIWKQTASKIYLQD